jgi:hypothetical protein
MTDIDELTAIARSLRDLDEAAAKAAVAVNAVVQRGPAIVGFEAYHTLHRLQLATGEFRHGLSVAMAGLPAPAPEPVAEPIEAPAPKAARRR